MTSREQTIPHGDGGGRLPDAGLSGFMGILKRHAPSIALVTLASLGLASAYLLVTPHIYTASTTLFIDPRTRKLVTDDVIQDGLGADANLVESQVSIITSDTVLGRAVDRLELDKDAEFAPPPSNGLLSPIKELIRGPRPVLDDRTRAIEQLSNAVKVKRAQKTYVVDIEVDSTLPAKAARIANAIAEAYLADQTASRSAEARRAHGLIDARLGELSEQVRKAETRIDEFKTANKILTSEGAIATEQELGKLNAELASARAAVAEAKARFEQAGTTTRGRFTPESLPESITSGLIQKLRDQYAQVARREAALASQLQAKHPELVEIRSQLIEITAQIGLELKRIAAAAKSEYQIAAYREQELQRTIARAQEEVARTSTGQIKLREYEREADASRELLRAFLARAKETQEQENTSTPQARVVSPAAVPARPSRPSGVLLLALGLIGGLGLGVARALAAGHLDRSLRADSGAATLGGLHLAATLPEIAPRRLFERMAQRLQRGRTDGDANVYTDLLMAVSDTTGAVAPAYRQAVLRLLARLRAGAGPGEALTLMFAGPHKGAGSSSTALAVAYAAALGGDRVLLVDAASADAELAGVFSRNRAKSETVMLDNNMLDNKEDLARIATTDARSGLTFLPIALADLRALKGEQRRRLMAGVTGLAQDYDLTIIDAGALLEDESAVCLVPAADRIALVGRAGVTTSDALALLADVLEPAADRIAGVVLDRA